MKIIYCILSLLSAILFSCENENQSDCNNGNRSGDPLTLKKHLMEIREGENMIMDFSYDIFSRLTETNFYLDDTVYSGTLYYYNAEGQLDSAQYEYSYGNENEKYTYGSDGNIETAVKYLSYSENTIVREFKYNSCRLVRVENKNQEYSMYTVYHYDFRGNTTEITMYFDGVIFEQQKFRYDNKINPLRYQIADPCLVQFNNIIYNYYSSSVMSSPPTEVYSSYQYDADGYPVKVFRTIEHRQDTIVWDYIYDE